MKKSELKKCIGEPWSQVFIFLPGYEVYLPVTGIKRNKIRLCGSGDPLFGSELLELINGMDEEIEVVLDI